MMYLQYITIIFVTRRNENYETFVQNHRSQHLRWSKELRCYELCKRVHKAHTLVEIRMQLLDDQINRIGSSSAAVRSWIILPHAEGELCQDYATSSSRCYTTRTAEASCAG